MSRCGAFPDPAMVPEGYGPRLPTCEKRAGHAAPHEARVFAGGQLAVTLTWHDPPYFVRVLADLEREYGRDAIRMWVERSPDQEPPEPLPEFTPGRAPVDGWLARVLLRARVLRGVLSAAADELEFACSELVRRVRRRRRTGTRA